MHHSTRSSVRSILHRRATILGLAAMVVLAVAALLPPSAVASEAPAALEAAELEVVRLHNEARARAGLAPLDVHVHLHSDARRWSGEMAARQRLLHQGSSSGDPSFVQTSCAVADPNWRGCAENVAVGSPNARGVHDAWMASTSHRANILNPAYNRVGIGVWSDGSTLWWTARFLAGTTADTADSTPHPQDGNYDPDGPAGTIYRLYRAYFLREPDEAGFEHWLGRYYSGLPLTSISDAFSQSPEFRSRYGSLGNHEFVTLVYANVLGREPDVGGLQHWLLNLAGGMTRGTLMIKFSDSPEFRALTADGVPPGYER